MSTPWMPCRECGEMIWGAAICVSHTVAPTGRVQPLDEMATAPYLAPVLRPFRYDPYRTRRYHGDGDAWNPMQGGLPSLGKGYS